jgi:hypothetical protein
LCDWSQFECNEKGCYDTGEALEAHYPEDARVWLNSVPFHEQGNGDYLALYVGADWSGKEYPVVYLDHDGCGFSRVLSASFDEFLQVWEELDYVHAFFLREFFVDPVTGHINPNSPKKKKLKALFKEALEREG